MVLSLERHIGAAVLCSSLLVIKNILFIIVYNSYNMTHYTGSIGILVIEP